MLTGATARWCNITTSCELGSDGCCGAGRAQNRNICLIYNLLSKGAEACAIAPKPLNIYLGMQLCYQGQTAATLLSQQSHLPPRGGGGRSDSGEKETGREREGDSKTLQLFVFLSACIFLTLARGRGVPCRRRRWWVNSGNLFLFFFCTKPRCSEKTLTGGFFFLPLHKIHISLGFFFLLLRSSHSSP